MIEDLKPILAEIREKLQIDKFRLEECCQEQPGLYREVGELFVLAKSDAKRLKDKVEYVKSDLMVAIRANPAKYGIDKVTEGAIASTIILQKEYQGILTEANEADELASTLQIFLSSVEQRKSMLKDMTSLFIHNYYSDTDLSSESARIQETNKEGMRRVREDTLRRKEENETENE